MPDRRAAHFARETAAARRGALLRGLIALTLLALIGWPMIALSKR
jgi:hypothetical protein